MRKFEHVDVSSTGQVAKLLGRDAKIIAGGTDLLTEMKEGIVSPARLVNIKSIRKLRRIQFDEKQGARIGALVTLAELAESEIIRGRFPIISKAAESAATPQIRHQGTVGGNICQDNRCWYFRGPFNCIIKGGEKCHAKDGENQHHAIFGGDPCYAVNPSDLAPALVALDAFVAVSGPRGQRVIPSERFFVQAGSTGGTGMTVLKSQEMVTEVFVPTQPKSAKGTYLKAMERKVWSFALASVAAQLRFNGPSVAEARVVLGGVATRPWRARGAERALPGRRLESDTVEEVAEVAVEEAQSLSNNSYKIRLVKGLVRQALGALRPTI